MDNFKHIGFIMDGNGRWAKKRLLPRKMGHQVGGRIFRTITEHCRILGLKHLTFYAFSTENWTRSKEEVDGIMKLLEEYIDEIFEKKEEYLKKNMRIIFIGDSSKLGANIENKMRKIEKTTKHMTGMTLNVAVNYGGRQDILKAVKAIAASVVAGETQVQEIDEALISSNLYTAGQPDPDLIIRTGGEFRLSNFLTWQSVYSEIYVTETFWPDFKNAELDKIIDEVLQRERRFGAAKA